MMLRHHHHEGNHGCFAFSYSLTHFDEYIVPVGTVRAIVLSS
jgi:hypothetical protein